MLANEQDNQSESDVTADSPEVKRRTYRAGDAIHQIVENQARRTPSAIAIVCGGECVSYRDLNGRANRLARHLQASGLKTGGCVAISTLRSVNTIVGLLGILKAGGGYVPLNFDYPADWIDERLRELRPAIVLVERERMNAMRGMHEKVVPIDDGRAFGSYSDENLDSITGGGDLAYVMFTSGSTGQPKGVEIPHRGVTRLLCDVNYVNIDHRSVVLFHSPLSFDASTFEIWAPLFYGGQLVILPPGPLTPTTLEEVLKRNKVTTLWLTASLFNLIIDEKAEALAEVRELLVGGEALSITHVRKALELLPGTTLINGYGPTESTTFTCCYRIPRSLDASCHSVPIGLPIGNTEVHILDSEGNTLGHGEIGELFIGGDGLALGYANRPDLTAERFVSISVGNATSKRVYRSGDLARSRVDGLIEYMGRVDRQVKIRGHRIEPGEIESIIGQYPGVLRNIVCAKGSSQDTQKLVAYLVTGGGLKLADEKLREFLKQRLPDYMVPAAFVQIVELPLTANGKVDVSSLPAPAPAASPRDGAAPVAPRSDAERRMSEIWKTILGSAEIGATDRFADLGGTSLQGLRLLVYIEKEFGRRLHPGQLSGESTIEKLASLVHGELASTESAGITILRPSGAEPAIFCFPGIGGDASWFQKMADSLEEGHGVYGVLFPDFGRGDDLPPDMEELAARCLKEIQRLQPEGPYFLVGYSFGGSVAYEVAQQIVAQGKHVAMLALLDADLNARPIRNRITRLLLKTRGISAWPLRKKLSYASHVLTKALRRLTGVGKAASVDRMKNEEVEVTERIVRYQDVAFGLYCGYHHRPYAGRLHVFWVKDRGWIDEMGSRSRVSYWLSLANDGLEAYTIPGDHDSLLKEPHVGRLASILNRCLYEANRRHAVTMGFLAWVGVLE